MTVPAELTALYPETEFVARIGAGAYGEVWLARFPGDGWRAVKFVAAVPGHEETAARERRAIHLLHSLADPAAPAAPLHPALAHILDLREADGAFAYTMPLADSIRPNWAASPADYRPRTLASDLLARRALPLPECLALAKALASALDFLQRHCLVHRDIKPSNVLYFHGTPVLADFGLLADTREAASIVGTPGYVPEEQHGRFTADIYSLGVLLTEATTGRTADEAGFAPVDEADTTHPLYARWLALLHRTTDSSPARRPQTAAAFLKELRALSAPPALPPPLPAAPPPSKWRKRIRWTLIGLALYILWGIVPYTIEQRQNAATQSDSPAATKRGPPGTAPAVLEVAPADLDTAPAVPAPEPPLPLSTNAWPEPYLAGTLSDRGAFLQYYADRIRVGLLRPGAEPEDCTLLLLYPEDTPRQPWMEENAAVPCHVCPVVAADATNTPPTFAEAPTVPAKAPYAARTSHTGIAFLPMAAPYPEVVFYFANTPANVRNWFREHPGAGFADIENLWMRIYVFRDLERRLPPVSQSRFDFR
jgi:serine/threonine protein kinase